MEKKIPLSEDLTINARRWKSFEQNIIDHITDVIDDPSKYVDFYSTRLITVLNEVYENLYSEKIVLFTNYEETFEVYRNALSKLFSQEEISFFGASLSKDEIEFFQERPWRTKERT